MRSRVVLAAKVALTVGLLAWLLSRTDVASIGRSMAGAKPEWVLAALALHVVGFLITAWRWRMLLAVQGADVPISFLARSCLVGIFFNNFLPSTVGGDVFRAQDTARFTGSGTRALTVVFVERFTGFAALGLFAVAAAVYGLAAPGGSGEGFLRWLAGILVVVLALALAFWHPSVRGPVRRRVGRLLAGPQPRSRAGALIREKVGHLVATMDLFAGHPGVIRTSLLLALLLQANVIVSYWCVSRSLGLSVPLAAHFLIVPVGTLLLLLPVSINGIGAREVIFVFLFARYGVGAEQAVAFSWINYALVLLQGVAGGIVYALRR